MAADLHIHIMDGFVTEEDIAAFNVNVLGSKYYNPGLRTFDGKSDGLYNKFANSANVWIGEVSWLKAELLGDSDTFVPNTVMAIQELIGEELPVLTEELLNKIMEAMKLPNQTFYSLNDPSEVEEFLRTFMGRRLFTISW